MKENLPHCLDSILNSEGGFSNLPLDPGGATNLGVTQATLAAWRGHAVSELDVRGLQRPEAEAIYTRQYADEIAFNALPTGLDLVILDTAVNSGPARAAKILQALVKVEPDGIIGVRTLAAVAEMNTAYLIVKYCACRMVFLQSLTTWSTFGKGWTVRVMRVEDDAERMLAGVGAAKRPPLAVEGQAKATGAVKVLATASGQVAAVTVGSVIAAAGAIAAQASGLLAPYGDIDAIRYLLIGCAVVSAIATMFVAIDRARSGATT